MEINYLDFELMEKMCHRLAVAVFDTNEDPIAHFNDHDFSIFDSAIQSPRHTFSQKDLYETIEEKAAVLYYTLNKNHPFKNGNKRIATASLLVFLSINNCWLSVPKDELLNKTLTVAKSDPKDRDVILEDLKRWIGKNLNK